MKLFLKIVLTIVIVFILVAGGGIFYLTRGLGSGRQLVINNVDLSSLNDGTYTGKYDGGRWTNEVSVHISNHKITGISLVKDVLFSKPDVTEKLFNRVIAEQKINVDVISGSTVTSRAYLRSIENALKK